MILGSGRFIGPRTLEVALANGTIRQIRGNKVIIGTGTRAAIDPIPGLAEAQLLPMSKRSNWTKSRNISS